MPGYRVLVGEGANGTPVLNRNEAPAKKVYVVTAGEYSDYRILAVFSDREKAESLVRFWNQYETDDARIEEYVLDEYQWGHKCCIELTKDGKVYRKYLLQDRSNEPRVVEFRRVAGGEIVLHVCERNISFDKLLKKASEIRTVALNEGIWGDSEKLRQILGWDGANESGAGAHKGAELHHFYIRQPFL